MSQLVSHTQSALPSEGQRSAPVSPFPAWSALPAKAGIGLKTSHADALLRDRPALGYLEVHAENYMGAGGPPHALLTRLRTLYPLSLHGVGLSIGAEGPLDRAHLARLKILISRYAPQSFSEHLVWSTHETHYFNDLLPVAYDTATLTRVANHIDDVQSTLGTRMLLENPSTYVAFSHSSWDEVDFIREIARRTGCGLLLDINNVQVSCTNHGRDPIAYLDAFPIELVGEFHLAGYAETRDSLGERLLIDAHDSPVADDVWPLYRHALRRAGARPTLIEWDNDVPALPVLLHEAEKANLEMRLAAEQAAAGKVCPPGPAHKAMQAGILS